MTWSNTGEKGLSHDEIDLFQRHIYEYYMEYGRDLPWRHSCNPYHIYISEVMLQQTQAERVTKKYEDFIRLFPDFISIARAPLREVMVLWQGLGYNRRALSLVQAAGVITSLYRGNLPETKEELSSLPGIGSATASSILAFAFNKPVVFIETNIRRVYIDYFFKDAKAVRDKDILPMVEQTLDRADPRSWYHALMDYGAMLGKGIHNPNRKSIHYRKQTPFKGSDRKIRGAILRILLENSSLTTHAIEKEIGGEGERTRRLLACLEREGFIRDKEGQYSIP